jgi:hypothetical protein
VGQIGNLRRIVNPPCAMRQRASRVVNPPATRDRRIANPPQVSNPMSLTSDPATILDKLGEAPIRAATQRKSWTNQK